VYLSINKAHIGHRPIARLANTLLKTNKVHETIIFLLVTLAGIPLIKKKLTHRLSNKPFLIWLLTTPSHLKYVAKLHCNLSLMACFADINVSQGSVATYARRDGIFKYPFNCKFSNEPSSENF